MKPKDTVYHARHVGTSKLCLKTRIFIKLDHKADFPMRIVIKPPIRSFPAPHVFQYSWDPDMASLRGQQHGVQCAGQVRHNPKLLRGTPIGYPR